MYDSFLATLNLAVNNMNNLAFGSGLRIQVTPRLRGEHLMWRLRVTVPWQKKAYARQGKKVFQNGDTAMSAIFYRLLSALGDVLADVTGYAYLRERHEMLASRATMLHALVSQSLSLDYVVNFMNDTVAVRDSRILAILLYTAHKIHGAHVLADIPTLELKPQIDPWCITQDWLSFFQLPAAPVLWTKREVVTARSNAWALLDTRYDQLFPRHGTTSEGHPDVFGPRPLLFNRYWDARQFMQSCCNQEAFIIVRAALPVYSQGCLRIALDNAPPIQGLAYVWAPTADGPWKLAAGVNGEQLQFVNMAATNREAEKWVKYAAGDDADLFFTACQGPALVCHPSVADMQRIDVTTSAAGPAAGGNSRVLILGEQNSAS